MQRSQEEAEVIVRLDYLDGMAHITVNQWPAMNSKMKRLYGAPRDEGQFVARYVVPLKAISFRRLSERPNKRPMSEEHKAKLRAGRAKAVETAA